MIHHDYTNYFNHSFSNVLKVLFQDFKLYEDPFDNIVEILYAYKVKNTFKDFIPIMKHQEFLPYEFVFDPGGFMDLPTLEGADSRANPFEERGSDTNDHGMNLLV